MASELHNTRWTVMHARDWVTNHPKSIKGYWPRRAVPLMEGAPKLADGYEGSKLVGIYLADNLLAPLVFYPLCATPDEYREQMDLLKTDPQRMLQIHIAYHLWQATVRLIALQNHMLAIETKGVELDADVALDMVQKLALDYPSEGRPDAADAYLRNALHLLNGTDDDD